MAHVVEEPLHHDGVDLVVLDDQHGKDAELGVTGREIEPGPSDGRPVSFVHPRLEGETAAPARLARNREGAAHRTDQPARDRKPETGTALLARVPRIDLVEGLEHAPLLRAGDSGAGVLDLEAQRHLSIARPGRPFDGQPHPPLLGELEPVADEVEQDLAELAGIALDELGHVARDSGLEPESFLGRAEPHQGEDVLDQLTQIEIPWIEDDLPRLDLRVVEDVVEDAEQGLARRLNDREPRALVVRESAVADDAKHAEDAVHGGADLVAHGREELALRLVGGLGPFSRPGVIVDLDLQPRVGIGELRGALRHQHLELALVAPELRFRSLAFPFELTLDQPLLPEDPHRFGHLGELVAPARVNLDVEVAPGEVSHDEGQGLEPRDDVALHIEPQDQPRDHEHHDGLEEEGDEPRVDRLGRPRGGVLGEPLRLPDQLHDEVAERLRERTVVGGEGFDRGVERQHLAPEIERVVRAGGVGVEQGRKKLPRLPQADRIGNAPYSSGENAEVPPERVLDPRDLARPCRPARAD